MTTQGLLRVQFWGAIAEHAPTVWRELAGLPLDGVAEWLARHHLEVDWCGEMAEEQVRHWQDLRERYDKEERPDPEAWRRQRQENAAGIKAILHSGMFGGHPLTASDREAVESALWTAEYQAHTPFEERILDSVIATRREPRLPGPARVFRFEVEGWRPDRTMGEALARIGWLVEDRDATGSLEWGEDWPAARARITAAFKRALDGHRKEVGKSVAVLRGARRKDRTADHLRLLVLYQVLEESFQSLGDGCGNTSAVRQPVLALARALGLPLRSPHRGGRPRVT